MQTSPGESAIPGRPDAARKRSRFLHSWQWDGCRVNRGRRRARGQECRGAASRGWLPPGKAATPSTRAAAPGPGSRRYRPRAGDQASRRAGPRSPAPRGRLTPCRWKPSAPPAGCSALAPRPMATARLRRPCPEPAHRPGAASTDSPSRRSISSALSRGRLATPTPDSDALSNRRAAPSPRTRAPPTSGCERRARDPDSGIPPRAAPPDPVVEWRAPGDELQ